MQVFGDVLILKVIIRCPVDLKLPVLGDQFQDCPEALGCDELSVSTPTFPGIDCEQLQGILWGQQLPQLLLTLRRERNKNKLYSAVVWGPLLIDSIQLQPDVVITGLRIHVDSVYGRSHSHGLSG